MGKYMAKPGLNKLFVRMRLSLVSLSVAVVAMLAMSVAPADTPPTGPELRAAVIVAILRFTSWQAVVPTTEGSQVRLCTVGRPPSARFLQSASGVQKVGGHKLVVDELKPSEVLNGQCNALVIGPQLSGGELTQQLAQVDAQALLTICDGCRGLSVAETIIQLDLHRQRVRFEVNLAKARANGVMLDAQLLELASVVRK